MQSNSALSYRQKNRQEKDNLMNNDKQNTEKVIYPKYLYQKLDDLSHNVYSDEAQDKSKFIPNYLIYNGKQIFYANSITEAINIAKNEKRICTIFEKNNSLGKFWNTSFDISNGIFSEN